ncbi:hypothetical protein [Dawidia soli]|uniref:Uncharacterized protein n=1 Tax=Dawidia soli TaxID=2782352 RepID=A0AAP2GFD5_9BACT|nr:hypothetical protein [Dawidia soli]MBT1689314.1 hypothetical protein [Dawidia soli]
MIATFFFLQLIAFQIWYITSDEVKPVDLPVYARGLVRHKNASRMIGAALMLLVTALFIAQWGWMTGICASLVGLMGVGSLVVMLNPFRYVDGKGVVGLYVFFLVLEFLV